MTIPADMPISEQIDAIITQHTGWKADIVREIRAVVLAADPEVNEEIKWRMATRSEGLAVWSHDGMLCFVEVWKDNVKLLFPKGAQLRNPEELFNARLKSKDIRAIEFREGDSVDRPGLRDLIVAAVALNTT